MCKPHPQKFWFRRPGGQRSDILSLRTTVLNGSTYHTWRCTGITFTVKSLSCIWLFETSWTVACQAPLSMGFSRQEYWRGLPFPSPRDLPNPQIEPVSPILADRFFTTESLGKPEITADLIKWRSGFSRARVGLRCCVSNKPQVIMMLTVPSPYFGSPGF